MPFFVLFDHITYYVTCGIFPLIYLFLSQDYISCTYTVFQALYLLNVRTTLWNDYNLIRRIVSAYEGATSWHDL